MTGDPSWAADRFIRTKRVEIFSTRANAIDIESLPIRRDRARIVTQRELGKPERSQVIDDVRLIFQGVHRSTASPACFTVASSSPGEIDISSAVLSALARFGPHPPER